MAVDTGADTGAQHAVEPVVGQAGGVADSFSVAQPLKARHISVYRPLIRPTAVSRTVKRVPPRSIERGGGKKIQATTYFRLSTIIGPDRLNGRVRNGNGCGPVGKITWKTGCAKERRNRHMPGHALAA